MSISSDYLKASWSISNPDTSDTITKDESFKDTSQIYLLWFTVGHNICANATSFSNAFNHDDRDHVFAEALLQLHLKTVVQFREVHKMKDDVVNRSDPIKVYLEVCTSDSTLDIHQLDIDDNSSKRKHFTSDPSTRIFMPNVGDDIDTIEYRLWIVIEESISKLDYGAIFMKIIEENEKAYNKYTGDVAVLSGKDAEKVMQDVDMSSYTGFSAGIGDYGTNLGDTEKFRLIRNVETYCHAFDSMAEAVVLTNKADHLKIFDRQIPFGQNMSHPRFVFSPRLYFPYLKDTRIASSQRTLDMYFDKTNGTWKFPKADHVVLLNQSNQNISRLTCKYLPDYQVKYYDNSRLMDLLPQPSKKSRMVVSVSRVISRPVIGDDNDLDAYLNAEDPMSDDDSDEINVESGVVIAGITAPTLDSSGGIKKYHEKFLDRESFEGMNSSKIVDLRSPNDGPSRSALHRLREDGLIMNKLISNVIDESELSPEALRKMCREQYLEKQELLLGRYQDQCFRSSADISQIGKNINRWFEKYAHNNETTWLGGYRPIVYKNLTIFGNMVARDMERLESSTFAVSSHTTCFTLLQFSPDAYRHDLDNLHFNIVISGPNSMSKSYALKLIKSRYIPNTVKEGVKSSKEADNGDVDMNDEIRIAEEVPLFMISSNKTHGGNEEKVCDLKERLTNLSSTKRVFCKTKNGQRANRDTYAQLIAVFLWATNEPLRKFDAALISRFLQTTVYKKVREDKSIRELIDIEKNLDKDGKKRVKTHTHAIRCQQFLKFHTQKLIMVKALTPVNCTVFDATKAAFANYLSSHYLIEVSIRDVERMRVMIEQLVYSTALEMVYSHPSSVHYKKDFTIASMRDLDPLIHDTEEIVYFIYSLMRSQFVSSNEAVVRRAIRKLYIDDVIGELDPNLGHIGVMDAHKNIFLCKQLNVQSQVHVNDNSSNSTVQTPVFDKNMSKYMNNAVSDLFDTVDMSSSSNASTFTPPSTHQKDVRPTQIPSAHYNAYVRIQRSIKQISQELATNLKDTADQVLDSQVETVLFSLLQNTIRGHTYTWDENIGLPRRNNTGQLVTMPAAQRIGDNFYVHLDLLQIGLDPVDEAIKSCYHEFYNEQEEFIDPVEYDANHPHIFHTRIIGCGEGRVQEFTDHSKVKTLNTLLANAEESDSEDDDETDPSTCSGYVRLAKSYNQISREKRCELLYLDKHEANGSTGCTSWMRYEAEAIKKKPNGKYMYRKKYAAEYPEKVINAKYVVQQDEITDFDKQVYFHKDNLNVMPIGGVEEMQLDSGDFFDLNNV